MTGEKGEGKRAPNLCPDLHRARRLGFPEVVYAPGKTPGELRDIVKSLLASDPRLLVTRADLEQYRALDGLGSTLWFHDAARVITHGYPSVRRRGLVSVISAGTTDNPVAEEAAITAEMCGCRVLMIRDVGVAGLHRVLERVEDLQAASVHIVIAGMEGALPSVVGGLLPGPIIAVPTSVGYGASFQGLAPLLGMLNSCAPGVTVVNIDNGFGAGFAAARILALGPRDEDAEETEE
ncbi:MAG TPA: nickel pincer cofactor biosynthesis protein LarB [Planctomycetes bacterium]|nr:nickel pincer cofactor biosynthesis protein LarB [Planctomycetota bacterium]